MGQSILYIDKCDMEVNIMDQQDLYDYGDRDYNDTDIVIDSNNNE